MKVNANLLNPPFAGLALNSHDALPAGTRFGEFEIIRVLGVGGFGIVYLAHDHSLERQVALKEYMPAALAARGAGPMITVRAASFAETFAAGLRSFINEARLLARFDHPSLVKVYRFWEDNGTAYMVMPYLQGRTLRDARRAMGHPPDEAWIRSVLDPLLDALERLHGEGVFHRDIAPDNILLPPGALPILLDFGAARRVIADRTQSLTAILKPSYAPIEQYAEMAAMRQGPWTDLYALGAVLHYLLFGVPPAPATARAVQPELDRNEPIERRVVPGVSPRFLGIVRWMLGVRPVERPQSVAALRAALNGQVPVPVAPGDAVTVPSVAPALVVSAWMASSEPPPEAEASPSARPAMPPHATTASRRVTTLPGAAQLRSAPPGTLPPAYVPPAKVAASVPFADSGAAAAPKAGDRPAKLRRRWVFAGGVAALAIVAGVLWQFIDVVRGPQLGAQLLTGASAADMNAGNAGLSATAASSTQVANRLPVAPTSAAPLTRPEVQQAQVVPTTDAAPVPATAKRVRAGAGGHTASAALRERAKPMERGAASAREACAGRNFFSRAVCMDRECERPRFRAAAECVKVLELKRRRTAER